MASSPQMGREVFFHEEQRFTQKWLWMLLLSTALMTMVLFGYGMLQQIVFGRPWGNNPLSDTGLVLTSLFAILFTVGITSLFFLFRLVTEVRTDGLYIRFYPFSGQLIPYQNIKNCEARTYHPIREYGGWGIRYGRKGKAYNVSGNRGVQLGLAGGKNLLIGSLRADEFAAAIKARLNKVTVEQRGF